MRLMAESGLWSTAGSVPPVPLVALIEVSGAVLSWPVDDLTTADAPQITFTDPRRADWLWRVVGEQGHSAVIAALDGSPSTVDLTGVDLIAGSTNRLRRLALGHWLRRWWPASARDGIAGLDAALLDAEIALLTAAAEEFFTDETLDSDIRGLLEPHATALTAHVLAGDPRIVELAGACADLAAEIGLGDSEWTRVDAGAPTGHRDDYALAAGPGDGRGTRGVIAAGTDSLRWTAVPPGIFDAAEETIDWTVETRDGTAIATVVVAVGGPHAADGIDVLLRSGGINGAGVLDAGGRVALTLFGADGQPVTESQAWDRNWQATTVTIGADIAVGGETPEIRDRIRGFARRRLNRPADDAYLAEIIAAESDY